MSDDLRELYQDLILDHGKRPRNFRAQDHANCEAVGHNPFCGDKLVLYISVDEAGHIKDVSFQGSGCAISTASASLMTEMLVGKTAPEARALMRYFDEICTGGTPSPEGLNEDDLARLQALAGVRHYPMRVKCATLPWRTLESALSPTDVKKVTTE